MWREVSGGGRELRQIGGEALEHHQDPVAAVWNAGRWRAENGQERISSADRGHDYYLHGAWITALAGAEFRRGLDRLLGPAGRSMLAKLSPIEGVRILVVGCGDGPLTADLVRRGAKVVVRLRAKVMRRRV